jgi:hypothetical protein
MRDKDLALFHVIKQISNLERDIGFRTPYDVSYSSSPTVLSFFFYKKSGK